MLPPIFLEYELDRTLILELQSYIKPKNNSECKAWLQYLFKNFKQFTQYYRILSAACHTKNSRAFPESKGQYELFKQFRKNRYKYRNKLCTNTRKIMLIEKSKQI